MLEITRRPLEGRQAIVTGASRGLGRVIATALADCGADVALVARSADGLAETAAAVRDTGRRAIPLTCDVTDPDDVAHMAEDALSALPQIDIVVANAGVAGPTQPLHEIDLADWRHTVEANLDSVFLTFRAFVPALLDKGAGSLLAVSSMTGKRPLYGRTPYAAAKLGVIGLVRTLAVELGPSGIRVNAVCPGPIEGERLGAVVAAQTRAGAGSGVRDALERAAALQRVVAPEEVAAACVFLASDAAAAITGEDLNVSAGLVMY